MKMMMGLVIFMDIVLKKEENGTLGQIHVVQNIIPVKHLWQVMGLK